MQHILSFRHAAKVLGVSRITVSDLVRTRGLITVAHPSNGKARGLDPEAMKVLRKALGAKPRPTGWPDGWIPTVRD